MAKFTNDEISLMIIYSPGRQYGRPGLIRELVSVLNSLVPADRWLRKHLPVLVEKLNEMSDAEFDELDLLPDLGE